jgi:hypothetical protein
MVKMFESHVNTLAPNVIEVTELNHDQSQVTVQ